MHGVIIRHEVYNEVGVDKRGEGERCITGLWERCMTGWWSRGVLRGGGREVYYGVAGEVYDRVVVERCITADMLGSFPKDFFQVATSQGYFPKWELSKCAISRAATSQLCTSRSVRPPGPS